MSWLTDPPAADPIALFLEWHESVDDVAVCLSTVTPDNTPSARMVLCRGADRVGFHFFTSHASPKARDLAANPSAAMTWYWPPDRQVRAEGTVVAMADEASDRLWSDRPRQAQLLVLACDPAANDSARARPRVDGLSAGRTASSATAGGSISARDSKVPWPAHPRGARGIVALADFVGNTGATIGYHAERDQQLRTADEIHATVEATVRAAILEASQHPEGPFAGAREAAEEHLRTWRDPDGMPDGRPLAPD